MLQSGPDFSRGGPGTRSLSIACRTSLRTQFEPCSQSVPPAHTWTIDHLLDWVGKKEAESVPSEHHERLVDAIWNLS